MLSVYGYDKELNQNLICIAVYSVYDLYSSLLCLRKAKAKQMQRQLVRKARPKAAVIRFTGKQELLKKNTCYYQLLC